MATPLLRNPAELTRREARSRIFASVFPPSPSASLPTPAVSFSEPVPPTPTHGYNTRHREFNTPAQPPAEQNHTPVTLLPSPAAVLAKGSRAWQLATSFLSFPEQPFPQLLAQWEATKPKPRKEELDAIRYLLVEHEDGTVEGRENLLEWYTCEVRRHFLAWVMPECQISSDYTQLRPADELERILNRLTTAQEIYLQRFKEHLCIQQGDVSPRKNTRSRSKKRDLLSGVPNSDRRVRAFLRSLNTIISYSLPDPQWTELVKPVLLEYCKTAVGITGRRAADEDPEDDTSSTIVDEMDASDTSTYIVDAPSFGNETDLDGDIIVTNDEGEPIPVERYDGMDDFARFKKLDSKNEARKKVLQLWAAMEKIGVGGGGRRGERIFAEVINTIISLYIEEKFAMKWESPSRAGEQLEDWVENVLGRLIVDVLFSSTVKGDAVDARLEKLSPRESLRASRQSLDKRRRGTLRGLMELDDLDAGEEEAKRRREDLDTWKQIAIGRLGRLRVSELFDIVVDWPNSLGGVEDLKSYITTPQTRLHLTTTFTAALQQRILHPAAATTDILSAYIRLIRAFSVPDPRGVLLDRVSRGIRRYLRDRDDTVRVIVRGIMADSLVTPDGEELAELAGELHKGLPSLNAISGLEDLDYDDMTWVPDPVDATPDFRRSKGLDVVGSLVSLYESKEVWVREIQNVLAARLLQDPTYDFTRETRTVELLKLRFGEAHTQACDVMLKDMADSKRVDAVIAPSLPAHHLPLHTKILSRLFWPPLKTDTSSLRLPAEMRAALDAYQAGFEALKKKRRLQWALEHGSVHVALELDDRVVVVDNATPVQAAAIHLFHNAVGELALPDIAARLALDPALARPALAFWIEKGVLREKKGCYVVLERIEEMQSEEAAAEGAAEGMVMETEGEEKRREREVVEQFVVGMLTNGGAMGTERIQMMLGMLVPGGYGWGVEELRECLAAMRERGRLKVVGGGWAVA